MALALCSRFVLLARLSKSLSNIACSFFFRCVPTSSPSIYIYTKFRSGASEPLGLEIVAPAPKATPGRPKRRSRANLTPSGRPKRRSRANLAPVDRPKRRSRANLASAGRPKRRSRAVFSRFFRATCDQCAKRPTSKKHCKNQYETHFGASAH